MPRENAIIGLLGLMLFVFGFYLFATNFQGMLNSFFSQDQVSFGVAIVFAFSIVGLVTIGLLLSFASLGSFEYKQQSKVKIYKGIQSEERVNNEATE